MNKSRIQWIDNAKGFTALLVVIGHILNSHMKAETFLNYQGLMELIHSFIYMFHMPLFMVLSGFVFYKAYCANRDKKKKNFCLQLVNIAWLYFFFAFALWCAKMVFSAQVVANVSIKDLLRLPIDPIDETWYLYVLFFLYILSYIIEKISICEEIKLGILLSVCFVTDFLPLHVASVLYRVLHYAFFFYLGAYLAKKPECFLLKKYAGAVYYTLAGAVTVSFFIVGDMAKINIVNILVAFILSMAVVCFFMGQMGNCTIVRKCFNLTGRYALEVYLLHTYVITLLRVILPKFGIVQFVPNMVISFFLCVLVPVWVALTLKKIKLHTIIFRPVALLKK